MASLLFTMVAIAVVVVTAIEEPFFGACDRRLMVLLAYAPETVALEEPMLDDDVFVVEFVFVADTALAFSVSTSSSPSFLSSSMKVLWFVVGCSGRS